MPPRVNALSLGPVVGHTDDSTVRIWIQVLDDPGLYSLRIEGVGIVDFVSTETDLPEFRTALATATGLHSDRQYRYTVLRRGRFVPRAKGTFRTMPQPSSLAPIVFTVISCSALKTDGAWDVFSRYVEDAKPQFVLMVGDQVYMDEDEPNVFENHLHSTPRLRRKALAEHYRLNWSREPVRRVLANVPTYMIWDDHESRDGWGSSASDSPTLLAQYPRGAGIFATMNAYFEDARDAYWHFQACHNPSEGLDPAFPNYIEAPPPHGQRRAMPFAFRCGRLAVVILDSRGDRDVFRKTLPVLGSEQWGFLDHVFGNLPADVEALAIVTSTPIASMDPDGQSQNLLGARTDDVELFKKGDLEAYMEGLRSKAGVGEALVTIAAAHLGFNVGSYRLSSIDEVRDQWSHRFCRPEQDDLIRKAGAARLTNRTSGTARGLIFLSGDIHVGCTYEISSANPPFTAVSLTSSGISNAEDPSVVVGTILDQEVPVARGIHASLQNVITTYNFGVVEVVPTGAGAKINGAIAHEGNSFTVGIDAGELI